VSLRLQVVCDRCGTAYERGESDRTLEMRHGKALSARELAARAGWHYDETHGVDTCLVCLVPAQASGSPLLKQVVRA
jgi:hypothetical protein